MPLYKQGGLTGSKASLQGIQDVVDRFFAGKDTARQQAQDDAMRIWEMAQQDPLIMKDPRAQKIFNKAGWPLPTITPEKESPQDELARLRMIQLYDELAADGVIDRYKGGKAGLPSPEETPQPSGPGWWSRLWGAKASPQGAPAVDPNALVSPPWEQLIPQAEKWLEPERRTTFATTGTPIRQPNRLMQAIRNIDTTPFRGMAPAQVPANRKDEAAFQKWYAGRAAKLGLNPNPDDPKHFYDYRAAFRAGVEPDTKTKHWPSRFKLPGHPNEIVGGINTRTGEVVAKEPATQKEFEQTVREMAKTDKKKARAYYDKWVSKWQ